MVGDKMAKLTEKERKLIRELSRKKKESVK
jgi:hypothetical protein